MTSNIQNPIFKDSGIYFLCEESVKDNDKCNYYFEKFIKTGFFGYDICTGSSDLTNPLAHIFGSGGYAVGSVVGIGSKCKNYIKSVISFDVKNIFTKPLSSILSLITSPFYVLFEISYYILKTLLSSTYCIIVTGITTIGVIIYVTCYLIPKYCYNNISYTK